MVEEKLKVEHMYKVKRETRMVGTRERGETVEGDRIEWVNTQNNGMFMSETGGH